MDNPLLIMTLYVIRTPFYPKTLIPPHYIASGTQYTLYTQWCVSILVIYCTELTDGSLCGEKNSDGGRSVSEGVSTGFL